MEPHLINILLIDDDENFLYLLAEILDKHGYQVYTASNGLKALEEMDLHKIDLVISDVIMEDTPIMSLTCTLKHLYPATPILLVSCLSTGPVIDHTLALGADEFLPKPIDLDLLYKTIDKLSEMAA
ncbi:response regulator [Aurantibacillus circumpalustris]|uniref:response regulator n=1 Tax=Aurantibacillus circumpalustris TaxID=3036359 RepID=UPI00295BA8F2|nr:response regulator [Aurantibacillus circumpalustris]